jgi:hypothetical protein
MYPSVIIMASIYIIQNKETTRKYVGCTRKKDPHYRWKEHIYRSRLPYENMTICNAIREEGVDAFTFYVIETCDEDIINEREKYWIKKFDTYNNGYNSTIGGSGCTRDIYRLNDDRIKPVSCYTLEGEHIRDYDSRGIVLKELGISKACLTACIKGTTFQSGGYRWSWKGDELVDKKARVNTRGKIYGIREDGDTMCWNSQADCAEDIEGNRKGNGNICKSIKSPNNNKSECKGWYLWRGEIPSDFTPSTPHRFGSESAKEAAKLQGTKCGRKGRRPLSMIMG